MKQSGAHPRDVKGMGISGQMHGLVMLDEFGDVIRPSIIWCGQTTGGEVEYDTGICTHHPSHFSLERLNNHSLWTKTC